MITLGFAAATILAANAQDTNPQNDPTTDVPSQTTPATDEVIDPQTQPVQDPALDTQDETLDTDSELMQDQARDTQDPAYSPTTEPTQDEVIDAPMEPMQEESTTAPVEEDPNASIDQMQEDVVEMQGEPAPNGTTEPQASTQQIGEEGGVMSITQAELPEEVTNGLQDSEFAQATVEEVYMLEDQAIDKLMDADAEQMYIGDQLPDKLYELRVAGEDGKSILYFDETGELLGSKNI